MSGAASLSVRGQLAGKRILITGATGFLGKVLLEKIIRDVPEVAGVVLLIRGSERLATARDRFDGEVVASSAFDRLRREDAAGLRTFCRDRIECITGEVTAPLFGLDPAEFASLAATVDVVVHAAASVEFRDDLERALRINTASLLPIAELVKMAGGIPLIHVSTCYVNGFKTGDCFEEPLVPAHPPATVAWNPQGYFEVQPLIADLQVKIALERQRARAPEEVSGRLVELGVRESQRHGWNDTYTFTKWIGEQLISEMLSQGTLTIVRPAIIESTYSEPEPGWIEGVKVADAIILAYAREKAPFFPARARSVIDIVPADLVANSLILAMAEALESPGSRRIYQCCTGSSNPITIGRMARLLQEEANRNAAAYPRLFPAGRPRRDFRLMNRGLFVLAMTALPWVIGIHDWFCRRTGIRSTMRKVAGYVAINAKLAVTFSFYAAPRCLFYNPRLLSLANRVAPAERALFPVDARRIAWDRYFGSIHLAGLERYALKGRSPVRPAPPESPGVEVSSRLSPVASEEVFVAEMDEDPADPLDARRAGNAWGSRPSKPR
jgi:nucleoside-diphosphate-sugar epimerase